MYLLNLPNLIISQLVLAEQNGLIKQVVKQTGELLSIQNKQSKKIKLLMIYPIFIFSFLIMIIIFIKLFFTFDYETSQLSVYLEILDWVIILGVGGSLSYIFYEFIVIKKSSEYSSINKKIRLPIIGSVFQSYYEYNLLFSIGLMIKNGMTVSDICQLKI